MIHHSSINQLQSKLSSHIASKRSSLEFYEKLEEGADSCENVDNGSSDGNDNGEHGSKTEGIKAFQERRLSNNDLIVNSARQLTQQSTTLLDSAVGSTINMKEQEMDFKN